MTGPHANADRQLGAKTRYRQPDAACRISTLNGGCCDVTFDHAQWVPTRRQYLVFYEANECLGRGVIES